MTDDNPPPPHEADIESASPRRQAYHDELQRLSAGVLHLGALACEFIPRGTEALLDVDLAGSQRLIDDDDELDSVALDLEEQAIRLLTLQAPVAAELRRVVSVMKMVGELERSADLMVNICKAGRRMYGTTLTPRIRGVLTAMSQEANKLLRWSLDAFADEDAALALALDDVDDELDQLNRDIVEAIFGAHHEGEIDLAASVQLALIARYYERIGDHAVNIGLQVNYMITGWLPEQTGRLRAEDRRQGDQGAD